MARGMQSLTQILRHSIITDITSNLMEDMVSPIAATMDMAKGLQNLKQMQVTTRERLKLILRHSTITDTIPRVMGEAMVIITLQAMGMALPMAMARGMQEQKLKPSIPITMDITLSLALVFRRGLAFKKAMVSRRAMVFRRAMVLHMG